MIVEPEAGQIFRVSGHLATAPISLLPWLHQQARSWSGLERKPHSLHCTGSRMERFLGSSCGHPQVMGVVTSSATHLHFSLRPMVTCWEQNPCVSLVTGLDGERNPGCCGWGEMHDCFGHETLCYFSVHVTETQ